ncbi:MAG: hypothetical protein J0I30_11270 [Burkholderiales bacterium]|nr:hypothetical protein [Burkholderiales bacterium]
MQAKDVIDRARIILQDAGADYWAEDELPKWLTDGRMEAYRLRPDLYEKTADATLAEGPLQELPDGSRRLFDVSQNVSHPKKRRITVVDDGALSASRPAWRSGSRSAEIIHYLYNALRGSVYEVYPPARSGVQVQISYAALPEAITAHDSTVDLVQEGEHAADLVDYVLYRAFLKEADTVPAFQARAAQHYAAFQGALTGAVATSTNPG